MAKYTMTRVSNTSCPRCLNGAWEFLVKNKSVLSGLLVRWGITRKGTEDGNFIVARRIRDPFLNKELWVPVVFEAGEPSCAYHPSIEDMACADWELVRLEPVEVPNEPATIPGPDGLRWMEEHPMQELVEVSCNDALGNNTYRWNDGSNQFEFHSGIPPVGDFPEWLRSNSYMDIQKFRAPKGYVPPTAHVVPEGPLKVVLSPYPSTTDDAKVWAEEFCKNNTAIDLGTMIGWFANAIEAGKECHQRRLDEKRRESPGDHEIMNALREGKTVVDADGFEVAICWWDRATERWLGGNVRFPLAIKDPQVPAPRRLVTREEDMSPGEARLWMRKNVGKLVEDAQTGEGIRHFYKFNGASFEKSSLGINESGVGFSGWFYCNAQDEMGGSKFRAVKK